MHLSIADTDVISPLGVTLLLSCCIALLAVDRKYALWPILVMVFFVSQAQRITIFTMDFTQMRILVLVGLARCLISGELTSLKRHTLDYLVIGYALIMALAHLARAGQEAIVYELGQLVNLIVPYFVFRCLVQNYEDLMNAIKVLSIMSVLVAPFFVYEHFTGHNIFSVFGGVPAISEMRQGRIRSQGAFSHSIIAGTYFAVIMPLIVAQIWNNNKALAVAGSISGLLIIVVSASSTPVFTLFSAFLAAMFFYFREQMQGVRWAVFFTLLLLHIVMKAPVWHLISRVSASGGSTSWYRYMLIDVTINHFSSWWLMGSSAYFGWYAYGLFDLTNQYVLSATSGGLAALILFISIITVAFGEVGRSWRKAEDDRGKVMMSWALGCSLFAICMSFIGVALWGQMVMLWPMVLAMIATSDEALEGARSSVEQAQLPINASAKGSEI